MSLPLWVSFHQFFSLPQWVLEGVCYMNPGGYCILPCLWQEKRLKFETILWSLNNVRNLKNATTSSLQISLHFWWEKVMLHVSTPLFQWVVCCSIHGLSANQCTYWPSAFHIEESITQYFYLKLTNSVQNVTPLLGRYPILDSDFKWRRMHQKNQTQTPKIMSSFCSSRRCVLQEV